jgi:hypothetical protein
LIAKTPQQVDVAKALNPHRLNPRDYLSPHDKLVRVRVLRGSPSSPNSAKSRLALQILLVVRLGQNGPRSGKIRLKDRIGGFHCQVS